jgi:tetratricopeptide (TPR) repeat protein
VSTRITPQAPNPPSPGTGDTPGTKPSSKGRNPYRRSWPRPVVLLVVVLLLAAIGLGVFILVRSLQARSYLRDAEEAIQRRDFEGAGVYLDKYLETWPNSPSVQFLAARTARRAGLYDKAEAHLARAQKLGWEPKAIELEQLLAPAQRGEISEEKEIELVTCTRPDKNHPDAAIIEEALTKGYLRTLKLHAARQQLDRWLELEPDNVQALLYRGWVRERMQNASGALEDYQRAVKVDPDSAEARMRLADAYLFAIQPNKALEQYQALQKELPDEPDVLLGLAMCRRDRGEREEAQPLLERILADRRLAEVVGPKPVYPWRLPDNLAPETRDWIKQCLQRAPLELRQPEYLLNIYCTALTERSKLALRDKDFKQARAGLDQVAKFQPYNVQVYSLLAQCCQESGDEANARVYRRKSEEMKKQQERFQELSERVMRSQRDPDLRCQLGELLLQMGNEVEGLRWLDSALREDPQHERTLRVRSEYFERKAAGQGLLAPR